VLVRVLKMKISTTAFGRTFWRHFGRGMKVISLLSAMPRFDNNIFNSRLIRLCAGWAGMLPYL
jgi:hypothetical protein